MLLVISALLPVFTVIVLGYYLRHSPLLDESAWRGLENLCYFVLFPVLLVKTLAVADIGSAEIVRFSGALLFAIFTMTGLLLLLYPQMNVRDTCKRYQKQLPMVKMHSLPNQMLL